MPRIKPNRIIVNEPGLYNLILQSRKPEALTFKRWITHVVLPQIRKTGGWIAGAKEKPTEAKANFVLGKPFEPEDLDRSVSKLLSTYR